MTRLLLQNLDIKRGDKILLGGFTHRFNSGEIYALVGSNGSGKTTLLKTLAGLIPAKSDQIFIDGADISSLSLPLRARVISLLLQHSPEQPYCTAQDRIAHGLMPFLGYDLDLDAHARDAVLAMACHLKIQHLLHRPLSEMSGGEQRLVHIAKCLLNRKAKILLLDEPSVFLDFVQQANVIENLKRCANDGMLVIFSSHDSGFIDRCAEGIIAIRDHQALAQKRTSSFSFLSSKADMALSTEAPSYNT